MSPEPSLQILHERFVRLTESLGARPAYEQIAMSRTDNGGAHAEMQGIEYAYVVTERGRELERRVTRDPDELLYWFVADAARDAALCYEGAHRQPAVDFRRLYFWKHVELLSRIRPEWGRRKQQEYELVLRKHPFIDGE